ncbi:MAG: UDP-N-acetylglucosamine 1-carboxyvinyltransferase [Candidatus Dadabacteria bacterium]|nr:UDP-N-acetylglucosamine 1-carboxyvinyltransferase [Candidatus Dadabacteria bacterium]NIS10030.1 UDP-N-acetylglucosamine 1-carboxyvinyltransferase [Candidatus Dadabacteria bacterium]NIY21243.1 UDP-N-acetylglucosamine 1-carboxyvinyltransferase [Candidatus Dadabacteria bacterium]
MDKIVIEGGNKLKGEVVISGAKNSVLPLMASTILTSGVNTFKNVPDLADVRTMAKLLVMLGAKVEYEDGRLEIDSSGIKKWIAPYELVRTMRASVLVLGPLTARFGKTRVSFPGGCAIGERPVDQHLKGLEILGSKIIIEEGYIETKARKLSGNIIPFDVSTVTGTENMMLASVLAEGETIILNAACEPEVVDLANALNKMGAKISGAGTDIINIKGVNKLKPIKNYKVMPDRIESGTLMVAAVALSADLYLKNCVFEHSGAVIGKLIEVGAEITKVRGGVRVKGTGKFKSVDITTLPYPGFPTDMQAQLMTLMSVSRGLSIINETIFPQRYLHAGELRRMGADIKLVGSSAVVRGVESLSGAPIMASDLRASASLVLAGLVASGRTDILRVYHLDRGYDRLDKKLEQIGAKIWREKE